VFAIVGVKEKAIALLDIGCGINEGGFLVKRQTR
jgi:hypothetical protein